MRRAPLVPPVQPDQLEPPARPERQVRKVRRSLSAELTPALPPTRLVTRFTTMAPATFLSSPATPAINRTSAPANGVCSHNKARREPPGRPAQPAQPEPLAQPDRKVPPAQPAQPDPPAPRAHKVRRSISAERIPRPAPMPPATSFSTTAPATSRWFLPTPTISRTLAHRNGVCWLNKAPPEPLEQLAPPAQPETPELPDPKVPPDQRDRRAPPDRKVPLAQQVRQARRFSPSPLRSPRFFPLRNFSASPNPQCFPPPKPAR